MAARMRVNEDSEIIAKLSILSSLQKQEKRELWETIQREDQTLACFLTLLRMSFGKVRLQVRFNDEIIERRAKLLSQAKQKAYEEVRNI